MNDTLKQLIIVLLILAAVASVYFGALAPLAKAQSYINALRTIPLIGSIDEFRQAFDVPLTLPSPVGQKEVVKYIATNIQEIITHPNQPENVMRALAEYIEPYIYQNDVRHLIVMGQIYYTLWTNYGRKDVDFQKAVDYFKKVEVIGPKLPPALYSLFDLYREHGDVEKAKEVGKEILKFWPNDAEVEGFIKGA